jgi:hypothetical protein
VTYPHLHGCVACNATASGNLFTSMTGTRMDIDPEDFQSTVRSAAAPKLSDPVVEIQVIAC